MADLKPVLWLYHVCIRQISFYAGQLCQSDRMPETSYKDPPFIVTFVVYIRVWYTLNNILNNLPESNEHKSHQKKEKYVDKRLGRSQEYI